MNGTAPEAQSSSRTPLSDILERTHFKIAAGLSPSIQALTKEINVLTRDWEDKQESQEDESFPKPEEKSDLGTNPDVQSAIMRIWDQFEKTDGNEISQTDYEDLVRRILRVVLPGLKPEHEQLIAVNTWDEVSGGQTHIGFTDFFDTMVRIGKMWTNQQNPSEAAVFFEDIFTRITCMQGSDPDSTHRFELRFWTIDNSLDGHVQDCAFGANVGLSFKGTPPKFQMDARIERNGSLAQIGLHVCWFEEIVCDHVDTTTAGATSRVWAPLDSITPMGAAFLSALQQVAAESWNMQMNIDVSNEDPPIESSLEGVRVVLRQQNGMPVAGQVSLRTIFTKDGRAVIEDSQRELCLADLLTVGLTEGSGSTSVLVRPVRSSVLYKLEKLRKGLQLEQTNPAFAARSTVHFPKIVGDFPSFIGGEGVDIVKLPTFPQVLNHEVALDTISGLVKPMKNEDFLLTGTLSSMAEEFIFGGLSQDSILTAQTSEVDMASVLRASGKFRNQPAPDELTDFSVGFHL